MDSWSQGLKARWRGDSCEIGKQIYLLHHLLFICWCVPVPAKDHNNYLGGADWNRCCLPLVWLTDAVFLTVPYGSSAAQGCVCVSLFHDWSETQIWIKMCSLWLLKISSLKTKEVTTARVEREPRHRKTDRVISPTWQCRSHLWCHVSRYVCLTVGQHAGRHKQVTAGNIQSRHVPARHHKLDKQGRHFLTLSFYSENLQAARRGWESGDMFDVRMSQQVQILYRPCAHVSQEQHRSKVQPCLYFDIQTNKEFSGKPS